MKYWQLGHNPSIDHINQIVEKEQSRLDKMFPGYI